MERDQEYYSLLSRAQRAESAEVRLQEEAREKIRAEKTLRERVGLAIVKAFERSFKTHGCNYDPDTCFEAADEVIATLVSQLTGVEFTAVFPKSVIGPAEFVRETTA